MAAAGVKRKEKLRGSRWLYSGEIMATELWAVLLVIFGGVLGSFGPIFLKKGSQDVHRDIKTFIFNKNIFIGLCFYAFGTIIFIPALKGGDLSVIYPLVS